MNNYGSIISLKFKIISLIILVVVFYSMIFKSCINKNIETIENNIKEIKLLQTQIILIEHKNEKTINNIKTNKIWEDIKKKHEDDTRLIKTTVTFYCPWAKGINSDSDPTKTATMTTPKVGYTIAISKKLFEEGWLGHKVYIEGFGIGKVEDRMHKKIKGNHIDICVASKKEAMTLGKLYNINMVRLD